MEAAAAASIIIPPPPVFTQSPITTESTGFGAPGRHAPEGSSSATAMDSSEDPSQTQTPDVAVAADAPAGEPAEDQPQTPRNDGTLTETPPPPPPPPAEEQEPATWADIEEDLSTPDEAELKEIESADGDYSAYECELRVLPLHGGVLTEPFPQTTTGRSPSIARPMTPNIDLPRRPGSLGRLKECEAPKNIRIVRRSFVLLRPT
jgi:hypothetical protein